MMKKVDLKFDDISNKLDESVIHETPVPPVEPVLSRREEQIRKSGHGLRTKDAKVIICVTPLARISRTSHVHEPGHYLQCRFTKYRF